jgi:2-polyprenyl-3-methyl-5-hydroxy-6-metoxy-1,4-benzoquinol methylase
MALETVDACPVCGSNQFEYYLTATDKTVTGESFKLHRCKSCKLVVTNPRPKQSDISKYYQSKDYISHTGGGTSALDRIYRTVRNYSIQKKLKLIARYNTSGSLLDYGCGTGQFLLTAKQKGWLCAGVEPSSEARQKIHSSLTVHESLETITTKFDVITLWHVLEHVHDLNGTLTKLRTLLNPGGTIFIAVPNHGSPDAQHYGEHWAGYDVPRHLWHFVKEPMAKLISRHQLKPFAIEPMKFDSYYVSMLSELHRKPGNRLASMLLGFFNGLRSNLAAAPDNYSSLIYIAGE